MSSDLVLNGRGVLTRKEVALVKETLNQVNKDFREINTAVPEEMSDYVRRLMTGAEEALSSQGFPSILLVREEDFLQNITKKQGAVESIMCVGLGPGVLTPGPPTATLLVCGYSVHKGRDGQLQMRVRVPLHSLVSEYNVPIGSKFVPLSPKGAIDQQPAVTGDVSFVMTLPEGTKDFERRVLILDGIERPNKETTK